MIRHFLTWTEWQGEQVAAVARHDVDAALVTVGTPDGQSKSGGLGGMPLEQVAEMLHRELLKDTAA